MTNEAQEETRQKRQKVSIENFQKTVAKNLNLRRNF
jgi:hypothetical protein